MVFVLRGHIPPPSPELAKRWPARARGSRRSRDRRASKHQRFQPSPQQDQPSDGSRDDRDWHARRDELERDLRVDTKVTARGAPLTSRVKRAEMTSSIGAGVLGADIALLLPNGFQAYALPSLALGLVMHVRGTTSTSLPETRPRHHCAARKSDVMGLVAPSLSRKRTWLLRWGADAATVLLS